MCLVLAVPTAPCVIRALAPAAAVQAGTGSEQCEHREGAAVPRTEPEEGCWLLGVCSLICNQQVCLLSVC